MSADPQTTRLPAILPNFPAPIFCQACGKEITVRHPGFIIGGGATIHRECSKP